MIGFQEKNRLRRIMYSKVALIGLFFLLLVVAKATYTLYLKQQKGGEILKRTRAELQTVQEHQATLKSKMDRLSTELGVEEEIREKFDLAKPGENVIVMVDKEATVTAPTEEKGWWLSFWSWLGF